jgi:hypothetical protein
MTFKQKRKASELQDNHNHEEVKKVKKETRQCNICTKSFTDLLKHYHKHANKNPTLSNWEEYLLLMISFKGIYWLAYIYGVLPESLINSVTNPTEIAKTDFMESVKLLLWQKVPDLMKQLWSSIKREYFHATALKKQYEMLKSEVQKSKWIICCELAKCAHKCVQICSPKITKPLTNKELMICMNNQTFLKKVNDIDTNYRLTDSTHIIGLLHDCEKVGMDLNLVWKEIEKQGQLFPTTMLSILQKGPSFYMSTLETITIEKLMTPIQELLNRQNKLIEDLQQRVDHFQKDQEQIMKDQEITTMDVNEIKMDVNEIKMDMKAVNEIKTDVKAILNSIM